MMSAFNINVCPDFIKKTLQLDGGQVFPKIQVSATYSKNLWRGTVNASLLDVSKMGVMSAAGIRTSNIIFCSYVYILSSHPYIASAIQGLESEIKTVIKLRIRTNILRVFRIILG